MGNIVRRTVNSPLYQSVKGEETSFRLGKLFTNEGPMNAGKSSRLREKVGGCSDGDFKMFKFAGVHLSDVICRRNDKSNQLEAIPLCLTPDDNDDPEKITYFSHIDELIKNHILKMNLCIKTRDDNGKQYKNAMSPRNRYGHNIDRLCGSVNDIDMISFPSTITTTDDNDLNGFPSVTIPFGDEQRKGLGANEYFRKLMFEERLVKYVHSIKTIFIDEAQFIDGVFDLVCTLLAWGCNVHVYYLGCDYNQNRFKNTKGLKTISSEHTCLRHICSVCQNFSTYNRKKIGYFQQEGGDSLTQNSQTPQEDNTFESVCVSCIIKEEFVEKTFPENSERNIPMQKTQ